MSEQSPQALCSAELYLISFCPALSVHMLTKQETLYLKAKVTLNKEGEAYYVYLAYF